MKTLTVARRGMLVLLVVSVLVILYSMSNMDKYVAGPRQKLRQIAGQLGDKPPKACTALSYTRTEEQARRCFEYLAEEHFRKKRGRAHKTDDDLQSDLVHSPRKTGLSNQAKRRNKARKASIARWLSETNETAELFNPGVRHFRDPSPPEAEILAALISRHRRLEDNSTGPARDGSNIQFDLQDPLLQQILRSQSTVKDSIRQLLTNKPSMAAPGKNMQEPFASREDIQERFATRLRTLQTACQQDGNSTLVRTLNAKPVLLPAFPPLMNTSVRYCPIEKTGSTTLRKIFKDIEKGMEGWRKTPASNSNVGGEARGENRGMAASEGGFHSELSFVFVREPYARLLSAYVDKLYSPNTLFWTHIGRYIVQNFRKNPSNLSKLCGHDVTFPEFIRYVLDAEKTGSHHNGHFAPIHDHCGFCRTQYDYIGHLETLHEDMPYLLDLVHSPVSISKENFETITLNNNANWVFKRMRLAIEECISMNQAGRRLWKKWQIRGLISKVEPYPFNPEEAGTMDKTDVVAAASAAIARSGGLSQLKAQKVEALQEAYSTVPLADRLQLQKMFFLDVQMFGFDPEPESVFPQASHNQRDSFSYLKW